MIGIKDITMPCECWECELTYENVNGLISCVLTERILYRRGTRKTRANDCPLVEFSESDTFCLEKFKPYAKWCEETGNEVSDESYQEYLNQEDINEHVI